MIYTETQILEKAKIILKDLKGNYYHDSCINGIFSIKQKKFQDLKEKQ